MPMIVLKALMIKISSQFPDTQRKTNLMSNKYLQLLITSCLLLCLTHLSHGSVQASSFAKLFRGVTLEIPMAKKGTIDYLKIDETTPVVATTHIRATFQACKGKIRIWVKQCNPKKTTCDDSSKWLPSSKNHDFTEGTDEAIDFQTELTKLCSAPDGFCDSHVVYYIAVQALRDDTRISALLNAFDPSGQTTAYRHYINVNTTLSVESISANSSLVKYSGLHYCKTTDLATYACLEEAIVDKAEYFIYYSNMKSLEANFASVCGVVLYGTQGSQGTNISTVFSSTDLQSYFAVTVLVKPNQALNLPNFVFTPVFISASGKTEPPPEPKEPKKAGRVIGNLVLAAVLILLILVLIVIIGMIGYWIYRRHMRKREIAEVVLKTSFIENN
jgi:hypothetical protein